MFTPLREDDTEKAVSVTRGVYFRAVHQKYRSRIERTFAWMTKWKWTQMCTHGPKWIERAMAICISFEAFVGFRGKPPYADFVQHDPATWDAIPDCKCVGKDAGIINQSKAMRKSISSKLWAENYVPVSQRPGKRSKDTPWVKEFLEDDERWWTENDDMQESSDDD